MIWWQRITLIVAYILDRLSGKLSTRRCHFTEAWMNSSVFIQPVFSDCDTWTSSLWVSLGILVADDRDTGRTAMGCSAQPFNHRSSASIWFRFSFQVKSDFKKIPWCKTTLQKTTEHIQPLSWQTHQRREWLAPELGANPSRTRRAPRSPNLTLTPFRGNTQLPAATLLPSRTQYLYLEGRDKRFYTSDGLYLGNFIVKLQAYQEECTDFCLSPVCI